MSVCVVVKVGEGLVLASDSAMTISGAPITKEGVRGPQGVVKVFYNATKLFQLGDLPVGILSWGAGTFQERTVASIVEEFENEEDFRAINPDDLQIESVAKNLWKFMCKKSDGFYKNIPKEARPLTGVIVAGYSKNEFFPEVYLMAVPTKRPSRVRKDVEGRPNFGANWYGLTDAIIRFHHGRDDKMLSLLENSEINSTKISEIEDSIKNELEYKILFHAMPLADAVDYAKFLIELTIARFRFVVGAELCGGPIDIAAITRKDGFIWLSKKKISNVDNKVEKMYKYKG